jgi:stage II sporulation protein D
MVRAGAFRSASLALGWWRSVGAAAILLLILAIGVVSCRVGGAKVVSKAPEPGLVPAAPIVGEPEIRVRVRAGVETVKVSGASRVLAGPPGGSPRSLPGPVVLGVSVGGGVKITDAVGGIYSFPPRTKVELSGEASGATSAASPPTLIVDGKGYLGRIMVFFRPADTSGAGSSGGAAPGVLDVIELVPIEAYLPGVVAAEVFPDWTLAAFETQAIAARTYALHQRELAIASYRDFDLEGSTKDQAYDGATTHPFALAGVRNTRGVVLTWQGRILRAYYSSTCGGRFAGAAEVWPTTAGYEYNLAEPIQAHAREFACQPARFYRWEMQRDVDELSRRVREWGRANGSPVTGIDVLTAAAAERANDTGRPVAYTLRDTRGRRFTLKAEELRLACNQSVAGLPDVALGKTRVLSGDLEFEFSGSRVTIRGRGFGHGVGMCQWCVQEFTKRGKTWQDLLPMFYPGAKIERAY